MEIYKQIKKDLDIVVVDYVNKLIDDRNSYKEEYRERLYVRFNNLFLDILSTIYSVDKNMLEKFKEVYGSYPTYQKFEGDKKRVEIDKKRMLCLIRSLKINKIKI